MTILSAFVTVLLCQVNAEQHEQITGMANWEANMQQARTYPATTNVFLDGDDHYDAVRVFQNVMDYTGDTTWQRQVEHALMRYLGYVESAGGAVSGYHNFNTGLAREYDR